MTGFGFGSLYGADPGSPYTDPTQMTPMGFSPMTPIQSAASDVQAKLAQYTAAQLAAAKARGMIGQNGVPLVPPSAFKVNSQGQPYSPDIQAQKVTHFFDPNDIGHTDAAGDTNYNDATTASGYPLATPDSQPVFHTAAADADEARADAIVNGETPRAPSAYDGASLTDQSNGPPTWDSKSNNSEQLLRYWMGKAGMNPTAQAGALSNLYAESRLNPYAKNPNSSAYGYAQWLNNRGLDNFAASINGNRSDPNVQAQFMVHELQTKFPGLVDQMNGAQSPEDAGRLWLSKFEGITPENSQVAGADWATMQRTHLGNASNFFNGKAPKAGAAYAVSGGEHSQGTNNVDDTSVDTSNMPPLTNLRALTNAAMVDPSQLQNPQTMGMLKGLLSNPNVQNMLQGNGNTSGTLARMAAGFFGGRGPAASLSGGFAGLAAGNQADQDTRAKLLTGLLGNQNDLYKFGLENNMNVNKAVLQAGLENQNALQKLKLQQEINAPFRQEMLFGQLNRTTPTGDAAVAAGLMKPDDPRVQQMNASWKSGEPVPAGIATQSQKLVQQIQDARNVQIAAHTVAGWAKNGDFQLDPLHKTLYNIANNSNMATDASSKYAAANQQTANIAAKLRSAFGNRMTDADLQQANAIVTGGTGSFGDNKVMGNHYDNIGNQAYQSELAARQQLKDLYSQRKITPKDADGNPTTIDALIPPLPASPYSNTDVKNIGTNYWGDNTTNPSATAAPGAPIGQPSSGNAAASGVGQAALPSGGTMTFRPIGQ